MKYFTLLISTAVISSLTIFSCKNEPVKQEYIPVKPCTNLTRNIDSAKIWIQGKWNWLEEKRADRVCSCLKYLTPQTEGSTYQIRFSNDTAFGYKNSILTDTTKFAFKIESEITNYPLDTLPVFVGFDIHTGVRLHYVPFKICKGYLLFQQQYVTSIAGEFTYQKIN